MCIDIYHIGSFCFYQKGEAMNKFEKELKDLKNHQESIKEIKPLGVNKDTKTEKNTKKEGNDNE